MGDGFRGELFVLATAQYRAWVKKSPIIIGLVKRTESLVLQLALQRTQKFEIYLRLL